MNRYKYEIVHKDESTTTGAINALSTQEARDRLMCKYSIYRDFKSLTVWQAGKCE